MRERRLRLVLVAVLLAAGAALGDESASALPALETAARAYEEGRFDEAAQTYEQLLEGGHWHETVLYNLGCARARQGRLGPAVLAFRRALHIDPRHEDARANLAWVRTRLADAPAAEGLGSSALERAASWVPVREGLLVAVALEWLAAALIGWSLLGRTAPRWTRPTGAALLVAALLLAGGPLTRLALRSAEDAGVVLATRIEARSGPGEVNPVLFTLHEGHEVRLGSTRGNWVRLVTSDGLAGWTPRESVAPVAPNASPPAPTPTTQGD